MSDSETGSVGASSSKVEHIRDDGHGKVADFVEGAVGLRELDLPLLLNLVEDAWVVKLYDDENVKHFTKSVDGTLIQCNDKGQTGVFGRAYEAWPEEFDDYVFSGQYVVDVIFPEESGFEVVNDD